MLTALFAFFLLLSPAAHAADHEYEIDMTIPTVAPPTGDPHPKLRAPLRLPEEPE